MRVGFESEIRSFDLAAAFQINIAGTIHHDFVNRGIGEQFFDWTIAQNLGENFFEQAKALRAREHDLLLFQKIVEQLLDGFPNLILFRQINFGIEFRDDALL